MTNEEMLQRTLNATIERLGKQAIAYEAEIANLNAQIAVISSQLESLQGPPSMEGVVFSEEPPTDS
jgi:hypothetical protein